MENFGITTACGAVVDIMIGVRRMIVRVLCCVGGWEASGR